MRLRLGNKHHLRKSADRKAQISSVSGTNAFLICAFRSAHFLRCRRVHHIGSTVRSNPPLLAKLNFFFFFLLSSPMSWSTFPRQGNNQCDTTQPTQAAAGFNEARLRARKMLARSLPKTEKLCLAVPSSTLTGLSSGVSLFRSNP